MDLSQNERNAIVKHLGAIEDQNSWLTVTKALAGILVEYPEEPLLDVLFERAARNSPDGVLSELHRLMDGLGVVLSIEK